MPAATQVVQAFQKLGLAVSLLPLIGAVLLICTAIYAVPRTSVLGAVLLTKYLGGADMIQLRVGNPMFETLFPVFLGALYGLGFTCAMNKCEDWFL